jgi:LuxR family transcriptional regulator, maltose regulon positive regulatory protein
MTMMFLPTDRFDVGDGLQAYNSPSRRAVAPLPKDEFPLIADKLRIPAIDGLLPRPRLETMLANSLRRCGATLLSGRSGTGKTALAASFAGKLNNVAWYSLEPPDIDWTSFSHYFAASIARSLGIRPPGSRAGRQLDPSNAVIAQFLSEIFTQLDGRPDNESLLIVLDDLHHVFDAPWFEEFFRILIHSLRESIHLLLLCRSRPPSPLWRLRSKQMLDVIDESLLAFNAEETEELFRLSGLNRSSARNAYNMSFGRVHRLRELARKLATG